MTDQGDDKTTLQKHEALMEKMKEAREKWAQDDDDEDDTDRLLSHAMEMAIEQGKGWAPGEKEEYMKKILDDDFIPPIFASNPEELEKSGLADAFTSLIYDDETPTELMLSFKKKGNDAFMNGRRSQVHNVQFYRDAINHYYEAFAWAQKLEPVQPGDDKVADTEDETYTEQELDDVKSTLYANAAMAHMQLKNWGHVRDDSTKALAFNQNNVKAWYRLAKAHDMLQNWEAAGDAIESGLAVEGESENKDLKKLEKLLEQKIQKARRARQQRERARAERVSRVKEVWKWCKESGIRLGRVPLVATVTDDEENNDDAEESRWHNHLPHTGCLPIRSSNGEWSWPCMFVYPSHLQSDFVESFGESEMLALRMAELFPELEDEVDETAIPWDYNNEFVCSKLTVYFEVHCTEGHNEIVHPESVELLNDQGSAMRFYEASRALKGDEGPEMANVARIQERKHLHKQRKAWKKKHGSLWAKPDQHPVVQVHPAATLRDVLTDSRMVVPNVSKIARRCCLRNNLEAHQLELCYSWNQYLVTFVLFPTGHAAHTAYLKEHKCIGIIQPKHMS
jgi:tetratricopeptide (TPR) repeat protein